MSLVVKNVTSPVLLGTALKGMILNTLPGDRPQAASRYMKAAEQSCGVDGAYRQLWQIEYRKQLAGWAHSTFQYAICAEEPAFVMLIVDFDYIWLQPDLRSQGIAQAAGREIGVALANLLPLDDIATHFTHSEEGIPITLEGQALCVNAGGRAVVNAFTDLLCDQLLCRTEKGILLMSNYIDSVVDDFLIHDPV